MEILSENFISNLLLGFECKCFSHTKVCRSSGKHSEMVLLTNDEFLVELTKMFQKSRVSGSITMTMKRYDGRTTPHPRDGKPAVKDPQYKCLVRAQSSSSKISTVIEQNDVEAFSTAYSNLLKTSMNGLKRLKKPKKKAMATQ